VRRIVLQISNAITPDVRVTLEAAKALSVIRSVDLDPGRVESILKIALSNALNVRPSVSHAAARSLASCMGPGMTFCLRLCRIVLSLPVLHGQGDGPSDLGVGGG
jgi:hypothetical protein